MRSKRCLLLCRKRLKREDPTGGRRQLKGRAGKFWNGLSALARFQPVCLKKQTPRLCRINAMRCLGALITRRAPCRGMAQILSSRTALDAAVQDGALALLREHLISADDGATGAVLIVDTKTREVRAAIGSSGLEAPGGWIDLTFATRSPGSTLKPFIYGVAFEDGLIGPATVVDDMPRSFGGYTPENFDRTFRGEVRIRDALQHSLNLPAVATLDAIGTGRFRALLRAAGVKLKGPGAEKTSAPGLALALGGAGVTARDLAMLYCALGSNGSVASPAMGGGSGRR